MIDHRKYGSPPYTIVLVHGGPGAPGEMASVARELSKLCGVLEPMQTKSSINPLIEELLLVLTTYAISPVTLIGHSWGAWLSVIFAARYPSKVKKLILISSGPFEEKYTAELVNTRLNRLTEEEKVEINTVSGLLNNREKIKVEIFDRFNQLMMKSDSYDILPHDNELIEFQSDNFESIWNDANELRLSGKLLKIARQIRCPVVAIHGDYDSHPYLGVQVPLSQAIQNFRFFLLANCGHYPWYEKLAKDKFYEILIENIR